jgi:hypothetical protein
LAELTENIIKKVALIYLKKYYRFRPRTGHTKLEFNMRAEGGIIVDGFLSFPPEEGKSFIATVEATSRNTREEVRYRVQRWLLHWDAMAASMVVVTVAMGYLHIQDLISIPGMGGWLTWSVYLLLSIIFIYLLYRVFFSRMRRYRYIYAIEQFKRYYADEQWVALGEDVFSSQEDRYFRELREQCIHNGFGLIIIDEDLRPHIHMTPSRVDLFNQQREVVEFFSLNEMTRRLQRSMKEDRWQRWFSWLPGQWSLGEAERLFRFRHSYFHQIIICSFCVVLLGTIFYLERQEGPVEYVDAETYEKRLQERKGSAPLDTAVYFVDSSAVRPFQKDVIPYLEMDDPTPPPGIGPVIRRPGLIIYERGEGFFEYDCERLYAGAPPRYVIAVEVFDNEQSLRMLIERFNQRGLEAMGLWLGCFSTEEDDFVLFLQQLYATQADAQGDLAGWQDRIEAEGFSTRLEIYALPSDFISGPG